MPLAYTPGASARVLTILMTLRWTCFPCPLVYPLPDAIVSILVQMDPCQDGTSAGRNALTRSVRWILYLTRGPQPLEGPGGVKAKGLPGAPAVKLCVKATNVSAWRDAEISLRECS